MSKRIYLVTSPTGTIRLIDANTAAQAVRFATKSEYTVKVASPRDVAANHNVPVEDAGAEE